MTSRRMNSPKLGALVQRHVADDAGSEAGPHQEELAGDVTQRPRLLAAGLKQHRRV